MEFPTIIFFRAKKASVHFGISEGGQRTRKIQFVLALESDEDIKTTDKRSLRSANWHMLMLDTEEFNETTTKEGALGYLSHYPARDFDFDASTPETCYVSVAVGQLIFNPLFDVLTAGRIPEGLTISVKGMELGDDFVGRDRIWDVASHRALPIVELSVNVPVAVAPNASGDELENSMLDDRENPLLPQPVTSSDIRAMNDQVASGQHQILRQLRYLVLLAVVALAAILLRK